MRPGLRLCLGLRLRLIGRCLHRRLLRLWLSRRFLRLLGRSRLRLRHNTWRRRRGWLLLFFAPSNQSQTEEQDDDVAARNHLRTSVNLS